MRRGSYCTETLMSFGNVAILLVSVSLSVSVSVHALYPYNKLVGSLCFLWVSDILECFSVIPLGSVLEGTRRGRPVLRLTAGVGRKYVECRKSTGHQGNVVKHKRKQSSYYPVLLFLGVKPCLHVTVLHCFSHCFKMGWMYSFGNVHIWHYKM